MAEVWIPSLLRDLTGGREKVAVAGTTVRQLIDGLEHQQFPPLDKETNPVRRVSPPR